MGISLQSRLAFFCVACLAVAAPFPGKAQPPPSLTNVSEEYLKAAADRERAAVGLPSLRWDNALSAAARQHAELMVDHNSISHRYAGEPDLASRGAAEGARFSLITENVAQAPSAVLVHNAWMHSEGHKHNLLDPNVDSVGISVISRNGQIFAVEDFSRSVASLSFWQEEGVVARMVQASGVSVDAPGEAARRVCEGGPATQMEPSPEFVMRYTTADLEQLPNELLKRLRTRRYSRAVVAACAMDPKEDFSMYRVAVLLYRSVRAGI